MINVLRRRRPAESFDDLVAEGRYDDAIERCKSEMLSDPDESARWQHRLGRVLLMAERRDEAIDELIGAAVCFEQEARPLQALSAYAEILRLEGHHDQVEQQLSGIANGGMDTGVHDYTTGEFFGASDRWRRCLPLFSLFEIEELLAVVKTLRGSWLPAGQAIYSEGDPADSLLALGSGEVVLSCEEKPELKTEHVAEGEYFGALCDPDQPFDRTARTSRRTFVIALPGEEMRQVRSVYPRAWEIVQRFQQDRGLIPA